MAVQKFMHSCTLDIYNDNIQYTADTISSHLKRDTLWHQDSSAPVDNWCDSLLLHPCRGAEYWDEPVCLSVCSPACHRNSWTDLTGIWYADSLWPWISLPMAALHYIMYFWSYG